MKFSLCSWWWLYHIALCLFLPISRRNFFSLFCKLHTMSEANNAWILPQTILLCHYFLYRDVRRAHRAATYRWPIHKDFQHLQQNLAAEEFLCTTHAIYIVAWMAFATEQGHCISNFVHNIWLTETFRCFSFNHRSNSFIRCGVLCFWGWPRQHIFCYFDSFWKYTQSVCINPTRQTSQQTAFHILARTPHAKQKQLLEFSIIIKSFKWNSKFCFDGIKFVVL